MAHNRDFALEGRSAEARPVTTSEKMSKSGYARQVRTGSSLAYSSAALAVAFLVALPIGAAPTNRPPPKQPPVEGVRKAAAAEHGPSIDPAVRDYFDATYTNGIIAGLISVAGSWRLTIPYSLRSLGPLRKTSDGSWRLEDTDTVFPLPDLAPIIFDASSLEHANASIIAATQAKTFPVPKVEIALQSAVLADLLPDGRATLVIDPTDDPDVTGKRIVLILSSQSVKEIARWNAARQRFAQSKGYGALAAPAAASTLTRSVEKGDPAKFIASLISTVRQLGAQVTAADDLSPLTRGEADFAVIVDWRFDGGYFDPKEFASRPAASGGSRWTFVQSLKYVLLDRNLHVRNVSYDHRTDTEFNAVSVNDLAARMPGATEWYQEGEAVGGSVIGWQLRMDLADMMTGEHEREFADRLENGTGLSRDPNRAMMMYGNAAAKGDVLAMRKAARSYAANGMNDLAVAWYTRAAKFGDAESAVILTNGYSTGQGGLPVDRQKAAEFAREAYANKRTHITAYNLGWAYMHGWDGTPDLVKAAQYFRESASLGDADARSRLTEIEPQLASLEAATQQADTNHNFAAETARIKTPAELYAIGDEQAAKGNRDKARVAFRAILTRFPNSPLAAIAAQRLAALGSN